MSTAVRIKRNSIAATLLLIIPVAIYIFLYVLPLGSVMKLSVDNGDLSTRLSNYSAQIGAGDKDARASALLADMAAMSSREQGESARLLNQEHNGFRSLFLNTARKAKDIQPTHAGLVAFDAKWNDETYWETLNRNAARYTLRHFQKTTGLKVDSEGNLGLVEGDDIYLQIMMRTLVISLQVTALTLLVGYPIAYAVANSSKKIGNAILAIVLLSFWTSILVRTTAWVVLLQTNGLINNLFIWLGIISEPLQLIFNRFGTLVSMTHVLLPFAIIPILNVMRTIPKSQRDASLSLGAGPIETFVRVYFPQSLRGVLVGGGTVFILALGFYVTPALTGGPSDQMLSFYIADFIKKSLNWGMAAALSMLLLAAVVLLLSIYGSIRWMLTTRGSKI
jgi:putative spermidine/putrescine transport system permease protein